ncbi:MAG: hypothetical protein E7566_04380 [Ruminococcaceae bacterium]|nr:hypothetical protein [Oscillospiraceae bacterium]
MNTAVLKYENNFIKISDFLYHQNDIYYNTDFNIEVRSGSFCGIAPCEYDIKDFKIFVEELIEMYNFKRKNVTLIEICYGSEVNFEADKTGHITISGEIFGQGMEHSLKFSFISDQTALKPFIDQLKMLIKNVNN